MSLVCVLAPEPIRPRMAGMGIRALELARALSRADFDVRLLVPNDPGEAREVAGRDPGRRRGGRARSRGGAGSVRGARLGTRGQLLVSRGPRRCPSPPISTTRSRSRTSTTPRSSARRRPATTATRSTSRSPARTSSSAPRPSSGSSTPARSSRAAGSAPRTFRRIRRSRAAARGRAVRRARRSPRRATARPAARAAGVPRGRPARSLRRHLRLVRPGARCSTRGRDPRGGPPDARLLFFENPNPETTPQARLRAGAASARGELDPDGRVDRLLALAAVRAARRSLRGGRPRSSRSPARASRPSSPTARACSTPPGAACRPCRGRAGDRSRASSRRRARASSAHATPAALADGGRPRCSRTRTRRAARRPRPGASRRERRWDAGRRAARRWAGGGGRGRRPFRHGRRRPPSRRRACEAPRLRRRRFRVVFRSVPTPDASIVVVHHRGLEHLLEALEALDAAAREGPSLPRSSSSTTPPERRRTRSSAGTRPCGGSPRRRNVGFAAGCRLGVEAAHAPAVVFVNDDAAVEPDAPRRLVAALSRRRPDVVAVGGRLTDRTGERNDFSDGFLTFDGHAFAAARRASRRARFRRPRPGRGAALRVRRPDGGPPRGLPRLGRVRRRLLRLPRGRGLRLAAVDLRPPHHRRAAGRGARHRGGATAEALGVFSRGFLFEKNAFATAYKNFDREHFRDLMPAVLMAFLDARRRDARDAQPRRRRAHARPLRARAAGRGLVSARLFGIAEDVRPRVRSTIR